MVLRVFLNKFIFVYLDDILVCSKTVIIVCCICELYLMLLRAHKWYDKMKKCVILCRSISFLGYLVSSKGMQVDPKKVKAISIWKVPKDVLDVRSFHGLVIFYRIFIKNFSTITTPLTKFLKKGGFQWSEAAQKAFEDIKEKLVQYCGSCIPDFDKLFEVECDVSGVGVVLIQEKRPIFYFSEKLSGAKLSYSDYDREFYPIVRALDHWSH